MRHCKIQPEATQVDGPQELLLMFTYFCSINDKKMILCGRVYWICHSICWISHPRLCFIAFKLKSYYPVPSHFQFSGRYGSGTGIPSEPEHQTIHSERNDFSADNIPRACARDICMSRNHVYSSKYLYPSLHHLLFVQFSAAHSHTIQTESRDV